MVARKLLPTWILLTTELLLPLPVASQPNETAAACHEEAKCFDLAERAATSSTNGELIEALRLYRRAYEVLPDPRLLFNIARIYHKQGRTDEAARYYDQYLQAQLQDDVQRRKALDYLLQIRAAQPILPPNLGLEISGKPRSGVPPGKALLITGGIFMGVGVVSLITGAVLFTAPTKEFDFSTPFIGIILMGYGGLNMLTATPILIVGGDRYRRAGR